MAFLPKSIKQDDSLNKKLNDTNQVVLKGFMEPELRINVAQYALLRPFIGLFFIIIFIIAYPNTVFAFSQNSDFEFEYLGNEHGLSNLRITSILQDHSG